MSKKLGAKIREARNDAGLTQEQLARKIRTLSASDISRIERGEKEPTQEQIKQIAKATGVTQKSLLELAKKTTGSTSSGKTSSGKTSGKTSSAAKSSMQVTAAERRLVELYRAADTKTKQASLKVLRGTANTTDEAVSELLGSAMEALLGKNSKRSMDPGDAEIDETETADE